MTKVSCNAITPEEAPRYTRRNAFSRIEPTMPPTTPPCTASLCCVGMYSISLCASLEWGAFAARFSRPGERCEKDSVTAKNHVFDFRHGRDLRGNACLERAAVSRMHQ